MLREQKELVGRTVVARDGDIGEIKDVYFDDEAWVIRYLEVDTHNLWPGAKKVLLATQWIDRLYETELYDFYGENGYWTGGDQGSAMQVAHAL